MRRRYRYDVDPDTGHVTEVEIGADWQPTPRQEFILGNHYEGTRATDGTPVDTKKKHAAYMKKNNLAIADDFKGTWAKAERERESIRSGTHDRRERREAIERAIYSKYKP
jgi:hypothetical protein